MKVGYKIFIAIIAAVDIVFYISSPILIAILWLNFAGYSVSSYVLFVIALISSMYRGIKIGFLKEGAFKER